MENKFNCILFIDDDKFNNILNKKLADKHKKFNKIISLTSGKDALSYLFKASQDSEVKPDLIFLDINMPAMNGWEFIEEFEKFDTAFTKDIKMFLLTTSSNPDDLRRSKTIATVNDYFNKPLTLDKLDEIIVRHLKTNDEFVKD
jgi:CheY-like chemotaxis protein